MRNLVRRLWRDEGEKTYGISVDGGEVSSVFVRPLSGGRVRIECVTPPETSAWVAVRKDLAFVVRHSRVPVDYEGSLYNYIRAYAAEIFNTKPEEPILVRTDGIRDPDGVLFVHGIMEARYRNVVKDIVEAGIDPRKMHGLLPPAATIHRAVEILEQRTFPKFHLIFHQGQAGVDIVGVRDGRPVFHRSLPSQLSKSTDQEAPRQWNLFQQITATVRYIDNHEHFGVPEEVVLAGLWPDMPKIPDEIAALFPRSLVRQLTLCDKVISETLTPEALRTHITAIGAAAAGIQRESAIRLNFLAEPVEELPADAARARRESVYDKIILACGAAMLALGFVTANAFFLDMTKSRLEKIAGNAKTLETLRAQMRNLRPELEATNRVLTAAAVRLESGKARTFSIPISMTKLLAAIESAAPDGVSLEKIESGGGAATGGGERYSNFFSEGGNPATVLISGKAELPEEVIFFSDSLRDVLGVSVDIVQMDREGDLWARKPVRFVIALRGEIRRA